MTTVTETHLNRDGEPLETLPEALPETLPPATKRLLATSEKLITQLRDDLSASEAERQAAVQARQAIEQANAILREEHAALLNSLRLMNNKFENLCEAFRTLRAEHRSFLNLRQHGPLVWAWRALRRRSLTAEYHAEEEYYRKAHKARQGRKATPRTSPRTSYI